MPFKSIVKNILGIKCMAIDKVSVEGEKVFIDVHPTKGCECRCGCCGCKGRYYDKGRGARAWRTLDCEGHEVYLRYSVYRVYCPHCKAVHICMVPWASHGSRFTERFEQVTAWVALQKDKSAASKFMRIAWHTVGDIMSRVFESVAAKSARPPGKGRREKGIPGVRNQEFQVCRGQGRREPHREPAQETGTHRSQVS